MSIPRQKNLFEAERFRTLYHTDPEYRRRKIRSNRMSKLKKLIRKRELEIAAYQAEMIRLVNEK